MSSKRKRPTGCINDECPICLREREPYMMRMLECGHCACKEHLNVWGEQSKRCPYCNQENMVPEPYLHQSLCKPEHNVLGLSQEDWEDNWNDWRWDQYDRLLSEYPRDNYDFEEEDYRDYIASRIKDMEKNRNVSIQNFLYAKRFPKYKDLQPTDELRYYELNKLRRILRTKHGYDPKRARDDAIAIEKGEKKMPGSSSFFRIPISSASGGTKTKSRRKKKMRKTRKFHLSERCSRNFGKTR